ncbi:hypothetical protein C0J50_22299 [Silurus asotus]|uniref:Uncharacterized protein n=1 Tax=Silurus asotus TaxID=30991 RepID=A0AAD5ALC0_SILAS|nr:hypothetical protein C0J50_22299 [Silurus asotus]
MSEGTEGKTTPRKNKSDDLDFFSEETDGRDNQLHDLTVKEADCSEGNMKAKIRPAAKRTKKPPKSLENFICRPSVRVFQRPEPLGQSVCKRRDGISAKTRCYSQLCHPVQKKCNTDSLVTKDNTAMTNTDPSALSPSSLVTSGIMSPPSNSPTTRATKKNPPCRKRGRPKTKLGVGVQANKSQVSVVNPPSDQNPEPLEPELDMKQSRPMARKRGRPKQSFSVQGLETQPTLISKKQDSGDLHITYTDKARNIQKCKKSKRVIMKTIIGKINKMKVNRKDQVLTQILLGQKQCDSKDISQEGTERDACSPDSTATHSLSSLVSSFGGKLGSQINVSKRGTIYMGKRRGRKPKSQTTSNISSQKSPQMFPDNPAFNFKSAFAQSSLDTQTIPLSCFSSTSKNFTSSLSGSSSQIHFSTPKVKATSFKQLSENSQACCEATLQCNSGEGINDNTTSDGGERSNRLDDGIGFCSASPTGSMFTMSGVPGSSSFEGRPKSLSSLPSERLFSSHLPLVSGRQQDSSHLLTFADQEAHKFKCHRKGHHCLSREKPRRHKYKCKKKYIQLKAKHQDPDFLADIEDLVVRLSKIRIVQRITRTKLTDDGNATGRNGQKGKCQSYDLQCLQEKVHPPAMFQINLSGYYSPHSAMSCEPLHYVRMANMRRKHGCSSEPNEQIVTHFPVMHKLGYPYPGGGFIHPSYKVPFTTTSLGFGLCRGYPSSTLYPLPFPPSYMHHYSKNPIISPSKFHKKRTKFPRQESAVWGQNTFGAYPRTTSHSSCDCFNTESGQRQKQKEKEKGKGRRDKHSSDQAGIFPKKLQCSNSSSSKEPEKIPRELNRFRAKRRLLNKHKSNHFRRTLPLLRDNHAQPVARSAPSTSAKVQHLSPPMPPNSEGQEVTDCNEEKKRGPGRPRKSLKLSSPLSLHSVPELSSSLTIEKATEEDNDNSDTVLEVIELVIQGEQRSGKKRKLDECLEDGDQDENEEKDVTERSPTHCHMCSAPIGTSPSQVEDNRQEHAIDSLPNKKYLWAGLYSDDYKMENIPDQPHQLNLESLEYNPEEHQYGLLPAPLHVGKYLRVKRINFQLPYDIHWQCARNKLFEKPVNLPQATPSNSSCNPPNSSASQSCSDDFLNTTCNVLQEENSDNENFPSTLSSEERSFVMKHGVFLVRNYEKMKARQAFLLREGMREQEKETDEDKESAQQSEGRGLGEDPTIKSGSSGQTLSDPLLNLCSRKRSDSALMDLSMVQKQLQSGHYESLAAFHSDMLTVFHCAEIRCPVCWNDLKDPVCLPCEHFYCRTCITEYVTRNAADPRCPECRNPFTRYDIKVNRVLRNLVDAAKDHLREHQALKESVTTVSTRTTRAQNQDITENCIYHIEKLKLFCVTDQKPICVVCKEEETHRGHTFKTLNDAFLCKKQKTSEALETLLSVEGTLIGLVNDQAEAILKTMGKSKTLSDHISDQFMKLRKFLDDKERELKKKLEEEENQILGIMGVNMCTMEEMLSDVGTKQVIVKSALEMKQPSQFLQVINFFT